jgi:hypothetical protein
VSTSLSQGLPEALKSIQTRPLFVLREQVPALLIIGQTPNAFRRIGVFRGARLRASGYPVKWSAATTGRRFVPLVPQAGRPLGAENDRWRSDRYDILAVGVGHRLPDGPIYNIFEVL